MKIQEKYLLIGVAVIALAFTYQESQENKNLSSILKTYELECRIQDRQLVDLNSQIRVIEAEQYNRGFEAGKTQAAITLMNGDSLVNYSEGYHAAVDQFGGEVAVNPFEEKSDEEYKYALEILSESIKREEDIEKSYLEIIEMLTSTKEEYELPDLPLDSTIVETD
jgi:hypothetical protein